MLASLFALEDICSGLGTIRKGTFFKANEFDTVRLLNSGKAILEEEEMRLPWAGLQWPNSEVCILASGPSMSADIALRVSDWRNRSPNRKVIVINTTFKLAPWADVLYACDQPWWKHYIDEVRQTFKGELWTLCAESQRQFGIRRIESQRNTGLNFRKGVINQGDNSGYQAIGLAYQAGAKKINLFGYDMKGGHWHPPHPGSMNKVNQYPSWIGWFNKLAVDLRSVGVKVTNYTPNSALRVFPIADSSEGIE